MSFSEDVSPGPKLWGAQLPVGGKVRERFLLPGGNKLGHNVLTELYCIESRRNVRVQGRRGGSRRGTVFLLPFRKVLIGALLETLISLPSKAVVGRTSHPGG